MAEPAFDWDQASSLLGDDPHAVDAEMAGIFMELVSSSETRLNDLKAMNADDAKAVSSLAHQLRGSLLNFGYTGVGQVLHKIEYREFQPGEFPALADEAIATFQATNRLIAAKYPTLGLT